MNGSWDGSKATFQQTRDRTHRLFAGVVRQDSPWAGNLTVHDTSGMTCCAFDTLSTFYEVWGLDQTVCYMLLSSIDLNYDG